jgi:hypothetical protein
MATNIDFVLDSSGKGILPNAGSVRGNVAPTLFRNDTYNARVRVVDVFPQTGAFADSLLTAPSFKLGIGEVDAKPDSGSFKLTLAGPVTSGNIPYNATTTQVFNAVSAIAGNVTITTFGLESNAWVIQAATANTALSFGGSSYTLFPTSSVQISTRRSPATDIKAEQVVRLKRSPAIYSDSFVAASTAGVVSLTKIQDGDSTKDETYLLVVGQDAIGGSFNIAYGSNSSAVTVSGLSSWNPGAVQLALSSITGLSSSNIFAAYQYSGNRWTIQFYGSLGRQNITTPLSIDASGVEFAKYYESSVTMATSELDSIFSNTSSNTKTLTLEIELTDSGNVKTLGQKTVVVKRDLVSTGDSVPSPQASYYTKAEVDAGFVPNSVNNVDSTNRVLHDSTATDSVDWQNRKLYDGAVEYVRWDDGLGFFGATAVSQPTGANVVSNAISLGLMTSSTTYGVLPLSIYTVTTLASVSFGTINANDQHYRDVVVTGANNNNIVLVGLPNAISAGAVIQGVAYKANTVCLSCTNCDTVSINVPTSSYRITVIGY